MVTTTSTTTFTAAKAEIREKRRERKFPTEKQLKNEIIKRR